MSRHWITGLRFIISIRKLGIKFYYFTSWTGDKWLIPADCCGNDNQLFCASVRGFSEFCPSLLSGLKRHILLYRRYLKKKKNLDDNQPTNQLICQPENQVYKNIIYWSLSGKTLLEIAKLNELISYNN